MFRKGDKVYCLVNGELKVKEIFGDSLVCEDGSGNQSWYTLDGFIIGEANESVGVNRCLFFAEPKFENWYEMVSRKEWKPSCRQDFYFVNSMGSVDKMWWSDSDVDNRYFNVGNCFKTKEEAKDSKFYKVFHEEE